MKKVKNISLILLVLALLIIGSSSIVVTNENEYSLIRQFGKVDHVVSSAGVTFKIPFVQSVDKLPKEILLYDLSSSDVITSDKKTMICCMVSGVLVCVNWGVYIFAINSGHVLDASLGYFLEPIFVTAIGVFLFHEKMSRLEQMTALFSIIGVGYLMGIYRMVPVMAMVIGLSFAFYGAVKKSVHLDAGLSLFAETLFVTPIALLFCVYSEMNGHGSLGILHGMQFLLFPMAGVITSVPLLLFNKGVKMIPYYLTGILMYVNPTIQFLMGRFYFHEPLEIHRLIAFCFIWVGVGFTIWHNLKEMRK